MSKKEKLVFKLLAGNADANFSIEELILILSWYEFTERKGKGSHKIFTRKGIPEMINL